MLTRLKRGEEERIFKQLQADPAANVRVSAFAKAYGLETTFFNLWRHEQGALLARFETSFFICGEKVDFEEVAYFLQFNPYFHRIEGRTEIIREIAPFLEDCMTSTCGLMAHHAAPEMRADIEIEGHPKLQSVYEVMDTVKSEHFTIPEFMPWYADVSHRIRHGCGRAYLLSENEQPASACLVSAESDTAGLLSGVSTKPQVQGRGYASAVVLRACCDLAADAKLPVLECLPQLEPFYKKLGFEKIGEIAALEA